MLVLGLDTTGPQCSVSLVNDAQVFAHISRHIGRGHAEALAPMVETALAQANKTASDVTKIAVCTGPGSFTGLRVALSFAIGFALPRKLPVIGLPSLAIWAAQHDPAGERNLVSVADVRRGELCWNAVFRGELIRDIITQPAELARAAILRLQPDQIVEDDIVDTRILAWLGAELSPTDYPAIPLYSRGPDAKLPGGKSL